MHDLLESRGVRVWFSEKDIALGKQLIREIDKGLRNSRVGIVLVTPALLKSIELSFECFLPLLDASFLALQFSTSLGILTFHCCTEPCSLITCFMKSFTLLLLDFQQPLLTGLLFET